MKVNGYILLIQQGGNMTGKALILGASGGFGGAMAYALGRAGWQVTRFERGTNMAKAAHGMDVIVNGLNPPKYHNWATLIPEITADVLGAAKASGATVLLPGNVYVFGDQPAPWGPQTPQRPCARKGQIRAEMEARYRAAAGAGDVRVVLLRAGDFLAPDQTQLAMSQVTLKSIGKGRLTTMGDPTATRAYAYLPDMARAAVALLDVRASLPPFADIPFAGHNFSTEDLGKMITRQTGQAIVIKPFPWWLLRLAAPFWELGRELIEMRYLYDHPHWLSGEAFSRLVPDFKATELETIVAAYLAKQA
jgi:nucleoside-diphosphate-sugar epimerase